jgi:phage terminase large subunit-like protein
MLSSQSVVDIRDFIGLLKHSRGDFAGQPFVLQPWQDEYLDRLFNTKKADGLRQYRTSLLAISRKNGKSALSAAIGLFMLCCDDEGAEVIVAAGDRSQAALLHTAAKQFVESCPSLAKRCKVYRNSIVFPEKNSTMICISSEAGTKHGYNPSCVLVDEYHVFPDRELVDVLETGTGARSQPLTIYITTAGTDMDGPCYKDWQRAIKIRDGVLKDESFLPCIYAADPEDDPFIEETWKKANPNYGITLKPEYFQQFAQKAKDSPTDEVVFRTLHLNQWQKSETKWIRHGAWDGNNVPLRPTVGRPCWCGLDLASTFDTTAFVAVWPDADGTYDVFAHFFIPEENAHKRSKEDRVPYQAWADSGFVTLTDGDVTCYDTVRDYILSFCEKNAVRAVAIDRWNAVHLTTQLVSEGIDVKPFGQGFASMSAPSKMLETLCVSKRLRHAGNPVLAWQMSNVQVKIDDAANIKPTKKHSHSTARIDGVVSLIMALGISSSENHGNTDEPTLMVL